MCFKISLNQMELIVVLDRCLFKIQSTPLEGAMFRDAPEPNPIPRFLVDGTIQV